MQTVLLTGAAGGIGAATAERLAHQGWQCVLVDKDATALQALHASLARLPEQAPHVIRVADLTDPQDIADLSHDLPQLDAVINNAGATDQSQRALVDQRPEDWQRLLDLNLHAPARILRALHAHCNPGARIVNVASGAGLHAIPWRGTYSASKAGLIAQTRAAARAYPGWRLHVLCPGFVQTPLVSALIREQRLDMGQAIAKIPLGRLAAPEEMACALAFLASSEASGLRADPLCVDGGTSVFGGSRPCVPGTQPVLPCDTPLSLQVHGIWPEPGQEQAGGYAAVLDTTVHASSPGQRLSTTLAAAQRFMQTNARSLTLLLPDDTPPDDTPQNWEHAGDLAAARMLVATLACEWGRDSRRINAVHVRGGNDSLQTYALWPVLQFLAGAQAQYVTGQTLWLHP